MTTQHTKNQNTDSYVSLPAFDAAAGDPGGFGFGGSNGVTGGFGIGGEGPRPVSRIRRPAHFPKDFNPGEDGARQDAAQSEKPNKDTAKGHEADEHHQHWWDAYPHDFNGWGPTTPNEAESDATSHKGDKHAKVADEEVGPIVMAQDPYEMLLISSFAPYGYRLI